MLAAKTADLIVIMLDATKSDDQRRLLEYELDAVGIRLNKTKPDVVFKKKTTGGVRELSRNIPIFPDHMHRCFVDHGCPISLVKSAGY
jgi:ribosome-interacting GTPase 1